MFNPLSLEAPYSDLTFWDQLPGYDSSVGVIEQLDLVRVIQRSGNYYWMGLAFPNGADTLVPGGVTISGSLQVPKGSYITSIQTYNDFGGEAAPVNPAGFKLNLYDKGSKANFFYGDYMLDRLAGSNMQLQVGSGAQFIPSDPGMNLDSPFGPQYRMAPIIVTDPGVIGWDITNQGVDAQIQVLVCLAVPINSQTIGQRVVNKGS